MGNPGSYPQISYFRQDPELLIKNREYFLLILIQFYQSHQEELQGLMTKQISLLKLFYQDRLPSKFYLL